MVDHTTANRGYPIPTASNNVADDVLKIIAAWNAIDADVQSLIIGLVAKAETAHTHVLADIVGLVSALADKAAVNHNHTIVSLSDVEIGGAPAGRPLITQASGKIGFGLAYATASDVTAAINALVNAAPGTLDTLNELAAALGDDPNFAATMTSALAGKVATSRVVATGTGLTGGGDLTANRTISANLASQAEAEAGTINTKLMTPLRVAQAISALTAGFGAGQSWQTPARSSGTSYQNTSGKPIMVVVFPSGAGISVQVSSNGSAWITLGTQPDSYNFVVPDDHFYRVSAPTISIWAELR